MNKNGNKSSADTKKILATFVMIITLMFCIISATYAYLAFTASNNIATGTIAESGLTLTITQQTLGGPKSGTAGTVMVPQLSSSLETAMGTDYKCVDRNGNIVCKVYKIDISTNSTATIPTKGTITFTSQTTNLKWQLASDATTLGSVGTETAATPSAAQFATPTFTATTQTFTYYIVIWINETNSIQTDTGTWTATIAFNTSSGTGITSTITS